MLSDSDNEIFFRGKRSYKQVCYSNSRRKGFGNLVDGYEKINEQEDTVKVVKDARELKLLRKQGS